MGLAQCVFPTPTWGREREIAAVEKITNWGDVTTQYLGTRMAVILAP